MISISAILDVFITLNILILVVISDGGSVAIYCKPLAYSMLIEAI